ncbi:MAG: dihydrofolate reductase [Ignavibacteriales bacterium]|nr:MAG: dihydrofolate reductase [Ignavibacteriales bacterium]
MKTTLYFFALLIIFTAINCNKEEVEKQDNFTYQTEQFADLAILRYKVEGFEELSLKQKEMLYYLHQAALSGRDIFWDQNYKHNLKVRRTLEAIVDSYSGNKANDDFDKFMVYAKRVWFSSGIHHHYSNDKFIPGFSKEYFAELVKNSDSAKLPLADGETVDQFITSLTTVIFDPEVDGKKLSLDSNADLIKTSAVNFYDNNLTQKEVEAFYDKMEKKDDPQPIWYGLNSKVVKENGVIKEKVWKVGGMYSPAIEKIVYWLEKASSVAENETQKAALDKLIEYYKTGDLETWDEYNILWVQDTSSRIDVVNGAIEVYSDPLGHKGAWQSLVSIKDLEATKRINAIGNEAQWFEDNSPIMDEHKKKNVVGISAKVITVVTGAGDVSPSSPIGVNLPNATWIRKDHGSKSVTLGNISESYDKAGSKGVLEEFCYTGEEVNIAKEHGTLSGNLHTDLHEVIGHASGQINPGVGTPKQTLKNYASAIEEARADLVALYYIMDQKLVDIGVMSTLDVGKAEYNSYIRNGLLLQLRRIEPGNNIEESHMRNRQAISKWVYEKGQADNVIEKKIKDGKTYFVITDYQKLRELFGQLLRETQRITSEGDFESAKNFIENYGVKVDKELHKEVLARYEKLNVAPYKGFINPKLVPVFEDEKIVDVKIEYPDDFTEQMMNYGKNYSFLPTVN